MVNPQQVKWAFSIRLMIISHSLTLNVLQRVSLSDAIPHIYTLLSRDSPIEWKF